MPRTPPGTGCTWNAECSAAALCLAAGLSIALPLAADAYSANGVGVGQLCIMGTVSSRGSGWFCWPRQPAVGTDFREANP